MRRFLPYFQPRSFGGILAMLGLKPKSRAPRRVRQLRNDASAMERADAKRTRIRERNLHLVASGGMR
jgi:hypothetical protein